MNLFEARLREFEAFHQSMANRLCHYAGLSLVTVGVLGLLDKTLTLMEVSLALWLLGLSFLVDLVTWPRIAVPVLLLGLAFLQVSTLFPLPVVVALLLSGFVIQVAAHKIYEKNEPAFATNMIHNHLGPRWLVLQWLQWFGLNPGYRNHLDVNTDLADATRWLLCRMMPLLGRKARREMEKKISAHAFEQQRLKKVYGLGPEVPVTGYNDALRQKIIAAQNAQGGSFAFTSGSTSKPKQILYTRDRLKRFKRSSALSSLQAFHRLGVENPAMFIFASLKEDDSFASLVVSTAEARPGFFEGLIEPAKYLNHPLIKTVAGVYGATGARLFIMALNSPGALYATNPSTLAVFLAGVDSHWPRYRDMFASFVSAEGCFVGLRRSVRERADWLRLISRVGRGNYGARIRALAESSSLPEMHRLCPDLKGYICWDGGYVTGFLTRIYQYLPSPRYLHIPMFSMSTETLQTELYIKDGRLHYLPTGDLVCYEFLPEHAEDNASELLPAAELQTGQQYTMVVSDPWGLTRYQTQDVFRCVDR
ncbi:MAG: GH3 auxin-responsive promoter family protein, partial [Ketobacteraceae bacterium]|nr:GH3 auxin-responsive promoter family protein [Ketobacteraceae bacterium]